MIHGRRVPTVAAALLAVVSCTGAGPRPVHMNEDACGYCRMEITDARFASQVVTRTGKQHVFDSVECLVGYLRGAAADAGRAVWVADTEHPTVWVAAAEAGFVLDGSLRAPMGRVVAFASPVAARAATTRLGGTTVSWAAILSDSAGITGHEAH